MRREGLWCVVEVKVLAVSHALGPLSRVRDEEDPNGCCVSCTHDPTVSVQTED